MRKAGENRGRRRKFSDAELRKYRKLCRRADGSDNVPMIAKKLDVSVPSVRARLKELDAGLAVLDDRVVDEAVTSVFDIQSQLERINVELQRIEGKSLAPATAIYLYKTQADLVGQASRVLETLYTVESIKAFQEEVLAVIEEIDPDVRQRIVDRLESRASTRRALAGG